MGGRAGGIAHVVQAVETSDQIEFRCRDILRGGDFEPGVAGDTVRLRMLPSVLNRAAVEVVADKREFGNAWAISTVDQPWPQPTSATSAPFSSFATTPSSAGSHCGNKVVVVARAEEAGNSAEHASGLIAPGDPATGAECLPATLL